MSKIEKIKEQIKKIKVDYNLISVKRQMSQLKNEIRFDNNTRLWGFIFGAIGFMGFSASTIMSIVGGLKTHKTPLSLTGFIIGIVFCQLSVYSICIKESTLKNKFPRYYLPAKVLQLTLFSISINYNYKFFDEKSLWNLALSIALEASVLLTTTIGGDFRLLNYQERFQKIESIGLLSIIRMLMFNKLQKLRIATLQQYNENVADLTLNLTGKNEEIKILTNENNNLTQSSNDNVVITELGPVKTELENELSQENEKLSLELGKVKSKLSPELGKVILLEERSYDDLKKEVESYLKENFIDGQIIPSGKICKIFGLKESQWKNIKKELDCITPNGTSLKFKMI